jgi:hypothetical protein
MNDFTSGFMALFETVARAEGNYFMNRIEEEGRR